MKTTPRSRRSVARPRPRRRRRSLAPPLVPLALLGLALEAVAVVLSSPRLQVHRVSLEGNRIARAEVLLDLLDVPCGTPLVRLRTAALEAKLEKEPSVARAEVETRWPDVLAIRITERVPAWNVKSAEGWSQADAGGVVFKRVISPSPALPILSMAETTLKPGALLSTQTLSDARDCVRWANSEPKTRLERVEIDRDGRFSLRTSEGFAIRLGTPVELEKKLSTMTRLAQEIPELRDGRTIEYVNLFMWDAPAVRYRSPAAISG